MHQDKALKPCMFCTSEQVVVEELGNVSWILCQACGVTGPTAIDAAGATAKWNAAPLRERPHACETARVRILVATLSDGWWHAFGCGSRGKVDGRDYDRGMLDEMERSIDCFSQARLSWVEADVPLPTAEPTPVIAGRVADA